MRGVSLSPSPGRATRAVIAVFAIALLATSFAGSHGPATAATDLSGRISSARSGQLSSERSMLRQDRVVARIDRKRKTAKRKIKRNRRMIQRANKRYRATTKILRARAVRLNEAEARFPDPAEAPFPTIWKAKLLKLRRDLRRAQTLRRALGNRIRITQRGRKARIRHLAGLNRTRRAAVARRESAEGSLAAHIVLMTSLAQQRIAKRTDVRLTSDGSTFAWPSAGTITQRFGCTGVRFNPRRGSCRHFHDGIDVVSAYGSPVRSAAVGVVAFVGWNPWDERGRAFIVVVAHPDGYVTRYGHLVPTRKTRAGQMVGKGQRIGKMGSTGFSTGTHLHMELLRYGNPLDPVAYFPDGVVKFRASQRKSRKNRAKRARAQERRKQAAKRSKRKHESKAITGQAGSSTVCLGFPDPTARLADSVASAAILEFMAASTQLDTSPSATESCEAEGREPPRQPVDDLWAAVRTPSFSEVTAPPVDLTPDPRPRGAPVERRGTSPLPQ